MAFIFHKKENENNNNEISNQNDYVESDIYKDYMPKEDVSTNNQENNQPLNDTQNNESYNNQGEYHEKKYNSGFLESHTKITKGSAFRNTFLVVFYLIVIFLGVVVYFMFRADKYQFYFKNSEVILNNGGIYQVELIPKHIESFDYLNYSYSIGDESIATVDEFGTVNVIGTGTTDLKVTIKPGFVSKTMQIISEDIDLNSIELKVQKKDKMESKSVVDMQTNETITLHSLANGKDNYNVKASYESSNKDVATVDEFGNVTAKKSGDAVITGTKDNVSGSVTIHVESKKTNPSPSITAKPTTQVPTPKPVIESISFSSNKISIKQGASLQLTLNVTPSTLSKSTFTWSSSNGNVSVDNKGRITAKSVGKSVITAKSSNGKTASCEVEVTNNTTKATSIKLSDTNITLKEGHSKQLNTTILPESATEREVVWSSSDSKVAMVDNGMVTGLSSGTATITVKTKDNSLSASCKVTVSSESVTPVPTTKKVTSVDIGIVETTKYAGESLSLSSMTRC